MRNLLFLIMILIILSGFLFFDFGKEISQSLSSVFLALQKKTIKIEILHPGTYEAQAKPGDLISISVYLKNPSSETVILNQVILGNREKNNFLSYFDKNSYTIRSKDPQGAVQTFTLIDSGKNASNGYRIFDISPSITLSAKTTGEYQVSAKLIDNIPLKNLKLKLSNIKGYGMATNNPIKNNSTLSTQLNIVQEGVSGYINIEGTKSRYNIEEQVMLK